MDTTISNNFFTFPPNIISNDESNRLNRTGFLHSDHVGQRYHLSDVYPIPQPQHFNMQSYWDNHYSTQVFIQILNPMVWSQMYWLLTMYMHRWFQQQWTLQNQQNTILDFFMSNPQPTDNTTFRTTADIHYGLIAQDHLEYANRNTPEPNGSG